MSLGFSGDQNRFMPKASTTSKVISKSTLEVDNNMIVPPKSKVVVRLPGLGSCMYTTLYVLLILSAVSALWVAAIGMWWIKYYVECNQGVYECPELSSRL